MPPEKDKAILETLTRSGSDNDVIISENLRTTPTLITLTNKKFNALLSEVREFNKSVNSDFSENFCSTNY